MDIVKFEIKIMFCLENCSDDSLRKLMEHLCVFYFVYDLIIFGIAKSEAAIFNDHKMVHLRKVTFLKINFSLKLSTIFCSQIKKKI